MPLALLGHISLNILGVEEAKRFYVTGLGGVVDPSSDERLLLVNVGASQLQLVRQEADATGALVSVDEAQIWAGHVELWTREELDRVSARLKANGSGSSVLVPEGNGMRLVCECPHGNRFVVRRAPAHFNPAVHGARPGGIGHLIALTRCVHLVRPGAAAPLHAFFRACVGATSELVEYARPDTGAPAAHTIVRFSSGQQLIFDERDHAPPADARERSVVAAYHVALYCDHVETFEAARAACEADGRVIINARFAGLPSEQLSTQFRVERLGTAADAARARAAEAAEAGAEAEAEAGAEAEAEVEAEAEGAEAALLLEVQVLSIAHPSCPLTRADLVRSLLDRACQHAAHQPHTPPASMQPTTSPTHASCPTRLLPHTPPPPVRR